MARQEEALPTLTISYQQLQDRSKLLADEAHPSHGGEVKQTSRQGSKSKARPDQGKVYSGGLLYLSPTKDTPKTNSSHGEERARRTRGKSSPNQDTGSQRKLFSPDAPSHRRRATSEEERTSRSKKNGRSASERRSKPQAECVVGSKVDIEKSGESPGDILRREWSRHENRKVERALSKWSGDKDKLKPVIQTCEKMQECAEQVLVSDLELFSKLDISAKLWKMGHYPVIEALRGRIAVDNTIKDTLEKFLASCVEFYSKLPNKVETQLSFKISHLLSNQVQFSSKTHSRKVMLAAVVCHTWYIALGDLIRYQQQLLSTETQPDWSKSRRYYLKAQQLVPKDGKPYNQLAVTAINSHRRLDAVYYYMRSLSTRPPFQSAYDSLVGIFADTSRKAERVAEQERVAQEKRENIAAKKRKRAERKKAAQLRHKQGANQRRGAEEKGRLVEVFSSGKKEIWMLQGTKSPAKAQEEGKSHDLEPESHAEEGGDGEEDSDLSADSAVRKASSAFVLVHGKLFTRTGVESLAEAVAKVTHYLGALLKAELRLEYAQLFLKMAVINIFSIHHAAESYTDDQGAMGYYSGMGLGLTLKVATVMLAACLNKLQASCNTACNIPCSAGGVVTTSSSSSSDVVMSSDKEGKKEVQPPPVPVQVVDYLSAVLPAVRPVFDWLLCQPKLYFAARATTKPHLLLEFWSSTANFLNLSRQLFGCGPQLATPPQLWEDRSLAGFMPLKESLSTKDTFALPEVKKMTVKEHREQCVDRVALMASLCQQHSSRTSQDLTFDPGLGQFAAASEENGGVGGGGSGEGGDTAAMETGGELEEEEEEVGEEVDLDESFGFSDSDSEAVIEMSSSEEEEEEESAVSHLESQVSEMRVDAVESDGTLGIESEDNLAIEQLKAQRDGLVRQIEERSLAREVAKNVLSEVANRVGQEMVITPRYLVPDTNCFVDMLASIKSLVLRGEFTVAVPLIVLSELEGLSKGAEAKAGKRNLSKVTSGAKNAVEYINTCFQEKCPHLRMLTSQGSLLTSLAFRAQVTGKASNDDLILESCLQLHKKNQAASKTGESCYKVVLLTDDRNLRVKAHANNQPVKDIPNFMKLLP